METIQITQNKFCSHSRKLFMFVLAIIHCIFFIILFVTQLIHIVSYQSILNEKCDLIFASHKNFYSDGCKIQIPFCTQNFVSNCECAALWIENNKSMTDLPVGIATNMAHLKLLRVLNCNLTNVPQEIEELTQLVHVDFAYNKLSSFNIDILKWKYILHLNLKFNNISSYNEEALWNHPGLAALWVNSNPHFYMPEKIYSPSLFYLVITNNSLTLPSSFGAEQVPQLNFFYAGGNQLNKDITKTFPNNFETLSNKIAHLDVARCNLNALPSYLSNFHNLFYIDARNNSISEVDKVFRDAIVSRKMENRALFSSNPICSTSNGKEINCAKMCSDYCNYKNWEDDELYPHGTEPKYCDPRCNSKECKWDGFDCDGSLIEP